MSVQAKTLMYPPVVTMATNMGYVMKFAGAFHIAAIVSTLSAKSLRRMEQLGGPFPQFVATLSRQTIDLELRSRRRGCFMLLLHGLLSGLSLEKVGCDS